MSDKLKTEDKLGTVLVQVTAHVVKLLYRSYVSKLSNVSLLALLEMS